MSKLIVGVGTGRCGTKSLTRLLSLQPGTAPTHERYQHRVRWSCPERLWALRLWRDTARADTPVAADVAFYWTPQVEAFLRWGEKAGREVRIVGLKRDREETIGSYQRWKQETDHWRHHGGRDSTHDQWDQCYPPLEADSKAEAIGAFWDRVYDHLETVQDDRLDVFPTAALNRRKGVEAILEHCGYDDPVVETNIKINAPSIEEARNSTQWE